ncbi:hypothetical protein [Pontibacter ramchanderi]|uniref:Uncharacterized protein n=1 Tax=Pontibacter ramchanderi TaxID=1179743 RepID=A0A2N3UCK1_9BACT|nr:hypothetical protein [Pontibacter ramchanderi]PKV67065.1 hypothetical protein BD749_2204 [Pontibacter ramchanderi]
MAFYSNKKRYLTFPLVWVMLLWAFTLPGHELAVYSYLINGAATGIASHLSSTADEQTDPLLEEHYAHVFSDAAPTSGVVLSPLKAFKSSFSLFMLAPPALVNQAAPRPCALVVGLLAGLLPVTILPNAP